MRVVPSYQATATLAQVTWDWSRIVFSARSPRTFQRRAALLTRLTRRRWRIEGGVQTQTGDQGYRRGQGLAAVEQVQQA